MMGDVIHDNMMNTIRELRQYSHANNKKNKAAILDMLAKMHNTVGKLDWGEDKCCSMEQSLNAVTELWNEFDEDD